MAEPGQPAVPRIAAAGIAQARRWPYVRPSPARCAVPSTAPDARPVPVGAALRWWHLAIPEQRLRDRPAAAIVERAPSPVHGPGEGALEAVGVQLGREPQRRHQVVVAADPE